MEITLARALKLKNRLQSSIRSVAGDLEKYNSIVKDGTKEVDTRISLGEYDRVVDCLISLKVKIFVANVPVYEKILRLAETKSKIKVLRSLDTQHGKVVDTYRYSGSSEMIEYEANFRKADVDSIIRDLEDQVDQIQEELDKNNHMTHIEIDPINFGLKSIS